MSQSGSSVAHADPEFERQTFRKISFRLIPLLAVCYGVAYIDRVNVSFAALQMNRDLNFSASIYGFGAGLFFVSYAACEVPANLLLLRFGARRWIARIMVTWGLFAAAMVLVTKPWHFYGLRFLLGMAEAGFFPGVVYYLTTWFPHAARARAISRFYVALPISAILMASASGYLLDLNGRLGFAGWQWMFLIEGIPAVLLGVCVFFFLPDVPAQARWLSQAEKDQVAKCLAQSDVSSSESRHKKLAGAIRDGRVWKLAFFLVANFAASYAYSLTAPLLLKEVTRYSNKTIGFIVAAIWVLVALVVLLNGVVASTLKSPYLCLVIPSAFIVLGCVGVGLFRAPVLVIASLALIPTFHNSTFAPLYSLASTFLAEEGAAGGMAFISGFGVIGGFLGPYFMGLVKDHLGTYQLGFLILSLPCFLAWTLIFEMRRQSLRTSATVQLPERSTA